MQLNITAEKAKQISEGIRDNAVERQNFINDPVSYLQRAGITLPANMVIDKAQLTRVLTTRHDPSVVGIAV